MKLVLFLILFSFGLPCMAETLKSEPAYSTQGIELDQNVTVSKPSVEEKNEQKEHDIRSKKYIKYQEQLQRQNVKKTSKQKELEYLEKRLELKKKKQETMFPNNEKGEKNEKIISFTYGFSSCIIRSSCKCRNRFKCLKQCSNQS